MPTATITHEHPRVIDGSGRSTLGAFIVSHGGETRFFYYSVDAEVFDPVTAEDAHAAAFDYANSILVQP